MTVFPLLPYIRGYMTDSIATVITVDGSAKGEGHTKSRVFFHELHCKKKF